MRRWLAAASLAVAAVAAQPNPFRRVDNWFTPPADVKFGALAGVVPAKDGDLWVVHRGEPPILKVTRAGAVVRSCGQGLFHAAHGAFAEPGIQIFEKGGRHLGTIGIRRPSSCAFGGSDRHTLYITGGTTLYRIATLFQGPNRPGNK